MPYPSVMLWSLLQKCLLRDTCLLLYSLKILIFYACFSHCISWSLELNMPIWWILITCYNAYFSTKKQTVLPSTHSIIKIYNKITIDDVKWTCKWIFCHLIADLMKKLLALLYYSKHVRNTFFQLLLTSAAYFAQVHFCLFH